MRHLAIALLLLTTTSLAFAVDIDVADGKTSKVKISATELNRIKVKGGRIDDIRAPSGMQVLEVDKERGEVFLRPTTSRPFSIFVRADNGEIYTLLLTPAGIPALNLVLVPATGTNALPLADDDVVSPYLKRIKSLMRVMHEDNNRYHKVSLNNQVIFDSEMKLGLIKNKLWPSAPGRLQGESWTLVNNSSEPIQLREREFIQRYKQDSAVIALAIEKHLLQPSQSTQVLIISRK